MLPPFSPTNKSRSSSSSISTKTGALSPPTSISKKRLVSNVKSKADAEPTFLKKWMRPSSSPKNKSESPSSSISAKVGVTSMPVLWPNTFSDSKTNRGCDCVPLFRKNEMRPSNPPTNKSKSPSSSMSAIAGFEILNPPEKGLWTGVSFS